jgi:inactivated superfamily I helicase
VRVATLRDFRRLLLSYGDCDVPTARVTAILVPTHAAAEQLRRGFESAGRERGAVLPPHLMTRQDWLSWLSHHVADAPPLLSEFEREVLLGVAARAAAESGAPPPFSLRATLVGEMLAFYDTFRRQLRSVDDFDRLSASRFEGDADQDRGAARMLAQARFMVAAFREYETRLAALGGADEHVMRVHLLAASDTPLRRVVVAVGDRAGESSGLCAADFDLLARLNGIAAVDVVATERALAAGYLQRLRAHLPGIAETTDGEAARPAPVLDTPAGDDGALHFLHRDREDELAWVVRRTKASVRHEPGARLDRTAVVFRRPLPYVYLARRTFAAAGVPYETVDALPLASEPAAAALDVVVENVSTGFARASLAALLRSPHFHFESGGATVTPSAVSLFDRELSEHRYMGDPADLERLSAVWRQAPTEGAAPRDGWNRDMLARVGDAALAAIAELTPLTSPAPPSVHLETLRAFLVAHDRAPSAGDDVRRRHLRARAAVRVTLTNLRDAFRHYDDRPRPFDETAASLRRWIERQTFTPHAGGAGVMVTDAHAARYGDFDRVYLVGATQRDWPDAAPRRIFFPLSMLTDLGWPE